MQAIPAVQFNSGYQSVLANLDQWHMHTTQAATVSMLISEMTYTVLSGT